MSDTPAWDGKPALTDEEWDEGYRVVSGTTGKGVYVGPNVIARAYDTGTIEIEALHEWDTDVGRPDALAALCLYDQPFGFTWEDVELLEMFGRGDPQEHIRGECQDLADRIAALLPPRRAP